MLLCSSYFSVAYCQVVGKAVGAGAKTAVKAGVRSAIKAEAKTAARSVVKQDVKQGVKAAAKQSAKDAAKKALVAETKSASKSFAKKSALEVAEKTVVTSAVKKEIAVGAEKSIAKQSVQNGVKKESAVLAEKTAQNEFKQGTFSSLRNSSKSPKPFKPQETYIKEINGKPMVEGSSKTISYANPMSAKTKKPRTPNTGGKWSGEKGSSDFVRDPNKKIEITGEGEKTIEQAAKDYGMNPNDIRVSYKNGYPDFENVVDPGTKTGKPLKCNIEEGIDKYINPNDPKKRTALHDNVYERLAEQQGVSVDEIKVFKGDGAAVERLMSKWNCSEQEVLNRCGNPKNIKRVLHESEDCKTVVLVPEIYHKGLAHDGGISVVAETMK